MRLTATSCRWIDPRVDAALSPHRAEGALLVATALLVLLAAWLPATGLPARYHDFADQRALAGLPHALDVLSNLPFAVMGAWGWLRLGRVPAARLGAAQRRLAALFFIGLVATTAGSAVYHLAPGPAGLCLDRAGMGLAFAGLLGLAAADRVSARAGLALAAALAVAAPGAALIDWRAGNMTPWVVLQAGGLLALATLALRRPRPRALGFSIIGVIALYALAKLLELADAPVFALTQHAISGHTAKHLVAALAAWPVVRALQCAAAPRARAALAAQSAHRRAAAGIAELSDMSQPPGAMAPDAPAHPVPDQFALLRQRRFAPFFWTQFAGAANDNLFKFAFTVMVTYQLSVGWLPPAMAGLVIGALFILPFLLFSATSGQLTDKFEKTRMIRFVKNLEIAIMALAAWAFLAASVPVLLGCVFLMGLHSTLFGPVKFAYLPQVLNERELTGGNGMVEMGTFVAILLGNVVGGLLVAIPGVGHATVAVACMVLALAGRAVAQFIPRAPATDPGLHINWNPISETWRNLKLAHGNVVVFRSMLGISWMWFFGAVFLSNFPAFAKEVLHGNEHVASLLLVVFSVGIGTGSLLCEKLSHRHVEIGLVPVGAIGMTVFAVDLYFASRGLPPHAGHTLGSFLAQPGHWRVMADLALLALFAGLYSVPMYALIQLRSAPTHRARIIAANNILNALFMIASAGVAAALLHAGFSIPQIFLVVGLANAVVAFYIFMLVPEYLLHFVAWVLSRLVYRYRVTGEAHIPTDGPAVLVANHVSFVDAVLLMAASPRPIRFLMDHRIFKVPLLGWLFKLAKAIPVAPQKEDPEAYQRAFDQAAQVLREGDLLGIFPEGGITRDGQLQPFKGGIMKILECAQADGLQVPVVPMALTNLWGSYFSRIEKEGAMVRPFRRGLFNRVGLNVGEAVAPEQVTPAALHERVAALLAR